MEKHLIDLFGDAGLDHDEQSPTVDERLTAVAQVAQVVASAPEEVAGAQPSSIELVWSSDAESMLKKVPFFVRGKARTNVEKYAREHGIALITADVLLTAKENIGA
jgi:light-independent protochlorophyllide reductase subunit B